jgi:hypothetical protein
MTASRDRIAALLSGAPQTGWAAVPQSQSVEDYRQFTPSPTMPRPFKFLGLDAVPNTDVGAYNKAGHPWDQRSPLALPSQTAGPDPWGLLEGADQYIRRLPWANEETAYVAPAPAPTTFAKDVERRRANSPAWIDEAWDKAKEAELATYVERGLDPGYNLVGGDQQ